MGSIDLVYETVKNNKMVVELLYPSAELKEQVQDMLNKGESKDCIEAHLKKNMCYFEWKIRHIIGGI